VPTTYALNHAVTAQQSQDFIAVSAQTAETLNKYVTSGAVVADPRDDVTEYIRTKDFKPNTMLALREVVNGIGTELAIFKQLSKVPNAQVPNLRNDMYLVSEALRIMQKSGTPQMAAGDVEVLKNYKKHIDTSTRFIPLWVKVAVALALGLGTMVGWKRIVVTVGEKIGKNHLTYGQGAAAEITAMATIGAADGLGLPVSTTHVLSSGVAGTMMSNRSGLQWSTVRNLALAWVLTLPAAMVLSGFLFVAFRKLFS
ncbi:MAG: inorganic phosphate transporter, partial [Candidatus Acidiferrum sp.]